MGEFIYIEKCGCRVTLPSDPDAKPRLYCCADHVRHAPGGRNAILVDFRKQLVFRAMKARREEPHP